MYSTTSIFPDRMSASVELHDGIPVMRLTLTAESDTLSMFDMTLHIPKDDARRDTFLDSAEAACVAVIEGIKADRMRRAQHAEPDEVAAAISDGRCSGPSESAQYAYEHLK